MYEGSKVCLTTKHKKEEVIAPVFKEVLSAEIQLCEMDTDTLGTFSGEVGRTNSAEETVRKKCEWGMNELKCDYGVANEGSFGPHPFMPFVPANIEIVYFVDRVRKFHLVENKISEKTNYQMQAINNLEELIIFANKSQFPSHALIVRPNAWEDKSIIFKGIRSLSELEDKFHYSLKHSADRKVWVETDMRAHMNPSRMSVIGEVSRQLAQRLASSCPQCSNPGWGTVRFERGLECNLCGTETSLIKTQIMGCKKCDCEEALTPSHGLTTADPQHCSYCNP